MWSLVKKWQPQCLVLRLLHDEGLQQCIETVMAEATDYRSLDDGIAPIRSYSYRTEGGCHSNGCVPFIDIMSILVQPATVGNIGNNVKPVFNCLVDQVNQYITKELDRTRESLNEAATLRERFVVGTRASTRVAAVAVSAAEAAVGESSFRSFMVAVHVVYIVKSVSFLFLPVDGGHAASCEEMVAMFSAEAAAYKGLQHCIETVMAEVE
ncbi:hypothetical protein NE237_030119 [Protea cynaroides]|uniref:Uncharacterized protein n=1 Tax=Protea cynaroides TaxID=273540 RepID=A0A9Q0GSF6_9MAGN|nr:hypothetical protein NE237_030119 [Protea cynaroides]